MTHAFFKNIIDNLDIPVAVFDNSDILFFSNASFQKITDKTSLEDIEKEFLQRYAIKDININENSYKILTVNETITQSHQDFISTVSHELRTPLTSIRGFADTMLMASDKLSPEQRNKFLSIIRNQADRLTRLVESLLEVSNMSKKDKFVLKEINFETFIHPVILIFEKKYPDKKYALDIQKNLPLIFADEDRLEQVISNLLDNASKYSPNNSEVLLSANFINNKIQITVKNLGEKIPENKLTDIFNKFSRIDSPLTRKTEGSGLGLFITKNLVENMNGSIHAENTNDGNIFIVNMPASSPEERLQNKISGEQE